MVVRVCPAPAGRRDYVCDVLGLPLARSPQAITWQAFGPYDLSECKWKATPFGKALFDKDRRSERL